LSTDIAFGSRPTLGPTFLAAAPFFIVLFFFPAPLTASIASLGRGLCAGNDQRGRN
jgi:hypothetical protein